MSRVLIDGQGLCKRYSLTLPHMLKYGIRDILGEFNWRNDGRQAVTLAPGEFWALKDVSLELRQGEALGVIGANGSGKSTLLRLLGGLIKPDGGHVTVRGRVGLLSELGAGMNPSLSGRENVYLYASLMGQARHRTERLLDRILDFSGIEEPFIDAAMQTYSSGMWVRLAYAVAAHLEPDILLVDEVLAVGDLAFQNKCIEHMAGYLAAGGAIVLVSHANMIVQTLCQNTLLLEHGRVRFQGEAKEGVSLYFQNQNAMTGPRPPAPASTTVFASAVPVRSSSDIVVDSVTVQSVSGGDPCTGEDAQIVARYRAGRELLEVRCSLAVLTSDGLRMITGSMAPRTQPIVAEAGQLTCLIPRLPLTPGIYTLQFSVHAADTLHPIYLFGREGEPAPFRVRASPSLELNLANSVGVHMMMDVRWADSAGSE